ncbi:aldehyde dehydrogenase family 3 member B1 isoform X1 [Bombyx mori]|uniref:Aldehyde dehydrogenase n=1 Tax=Bombyx mori TaxID=7091 RepID=A0A8R2AXY1_BOMMO|nr:aldehyde dehydrogenase family 3 member B1 isoform X1 [Bombyx mori]
MPLGEQATENIHIIDIENNIDVTRNFTEAEIRQSVEEKSNPKVSAASREISIEQAVQKVRETYNSGVTRCLKWRRKQLRNLYRMYEENANLMLDVLYQDLRRSKTESLLLEIDYMKNDLKHVLYNLDSWTKPERPDRDFVNWLDQVFIYHDPYGVVLIIGAWNYPLALSLLPMAGAIAAGNTVIVKPSEISPASARFIVEYIPKYLDNDAVIIIEGGPQETTKLLSHRFDYIFYTGSTNIGKIIYASAAKHLTPVTLELGGKSPVYIDDTADLEMTVDRILWGKFINAGQTCIAPDYVLCTKEIQEKFIQKSKRILKKWFGDDPQKTPDYSRIVNNRHFSRLQAVLDASRHKIAIGGKYDPGDKFIDLTILTNVDVNDKIMEDEIFGPLLAICVVKDINEALKFINERGKPLVLYVFSSSEKVHKIFASHTSSGSICFNDTIVFTGVHTLPFGGVGSSGIGTYHGKMTYDTFTHRKSCLKRNFFSVGNKLSSLRNPPYNEWKLRVAREVMRKKNIPSFDFFWPLITFIIGCSITYYMLNMQKVQPEVLNGTNSTIYS